MGRHRKSIKKNKTPKAQTGTAKVSWGLFERFFLPWTGIIILAHALTMYVAPAFMWGVHFYHFYPAWIGWVLALLSLTLLIPVVGEYVYLRLEALAQKINRPFVGWGENKVFSLLSLLSIPLFWLFRTKLHLLGDGMFRISDLPQGKIHLQEWLDAFIHLIFYRGMLKLFPSWTPEFTYSVISVLCGGLFVFLTLKLSSLLGKSSFGKIFIFSFLITLGSVQLFFGYVESYSILQVVILAYIFFSARYLLGKSNLIPALLLLMISVGLHTTSLIFAPSFIYLLLKKNSRAGKIHTEEGSKTKPSLNALTVIALILSSVIILFWVQRVATGLEKTGKGIFILPLVNKANYPFGLFSLAHLSEFANQLLLLSPLGISLMVLFLLFRIRFGKSFLGQSPHPKHIPRVDGLLNFLILAVIFGLIYLFVFNFTLGSADWDLRCSSASFIGLLAALLFLRWGEGLSSDGSPNSVDQTSEVRSEKRFKTWGMIFIFLGLFHTVPWVLINAHYQRSLDRYLLIQENDPHPVDETQYNTYKIARILRMAQLGPTEIYNLYKRAIQREPGNPLNYYNLGSEYYKNDQLDSAIHYLNLGLEIEPRYPRPHWLLGTIYNSLGDLDKALLHLEACAPWSMENPAFLLEFGQVLQKKGNLDQAEQCALRIIQLVPNDPTAYHLLGSICVEKKDFETAKKVWTQILKFSPQDSVAIYNLRQLESQSEK
jgi:hypothetical protein